MQHRVGCLFDGRHRRNARTVDEIVDASPSRNRVIDERPCSCLIANLGAVDEQPRRGRAEQCSFLEFGFGSSSDSKMMSLLSEQECNCAADGAACARDDGDRSSQGSARTAGLAN